MSKILNALRHCPATLTLVAIGWIANVGLAVGLGIGPAASTGGPLAQVTHIPGWSRPLVAVFTTSDGLALLLVTSFALAVGAWAEPRLGSWRLALIAVGGQLCGIIFGAAVVFALFAVGLTKSAVLVDETVISMSPWVIAILMATTWRVDRVGSRRIRVATFVTLTVLCLIVGNLVEVVRIGAALAGLAFGYTPAAGGRRGKPMGARADIPANIAIIIAALGTSGLISAIFRHPAGPMAQIERLIFVSRLRPISLANHCFPNGFSSITTRIADPSCAVELARASGGAISPILHHVALFLLFIALADGLSRSRRAAWFIAVFTQLFAIVRGLVWVHLVPADVVFPSHHILSALPPLYFQIGISVCALILLLCTHRSFQVRARTGTYQLAAKRAALIIVTGLIVLTLLYALEPRAWSAPQSFVQLIAGAPAQLLAIALTILLWRTFAATGQVVPSERFFVRPEEQDAGAHLRRLVTEGGGSLSWMSTWAGNQPWIDRMGEAGWGYRVVEGVALATADPVGKVVDTARIVHEFGAFAQKNGWIPALYSTHAKVAKAAQDLGWTAVRVAEEAVVPMESFTLVGKKYQDLRTAKNRAAREGVHVEEVTWADLPEGGRDQIRAICAQWVEGKALPEMHFTLGGVAELEDPAVSLLIAVDDDRTIHGVTSWLPVYRDGVLVGRTLDVMRRREGGFKQVIELLLVEQAIACQEAGLEFVSLSGAPLAPAPASAEQSEIQERAFLSDSLDRVGRMLEPVYGFRSLARFKAKFQPAYEPMYLLVPDVAELPAVGFAIGRAYLPDFGVTDASMMGARWLRAKLGV
ncbi:MULTISPECIES: DUF2156 domain-containing protein [unclassified Winkia]|nr:MULTISPECIES: DUF2156 domain-containing protein [unclassified Winkia]MDK7163105.1 DUF2156 domain-containing protein [Winkia sp. UMB3105]MDK8594712.1 DUF2156 domain-containing protein [Winkia sp. UMB1096A]